MRSVKHLLNRWRRRAHADADVRVDGLVITDLFGGRRGEEVGGKGRGLARLAEAGLPVLRTRVVPVCTYEAFTERGHLPPSWAARLTAEARTLGDRVAVRSSATEEDGERSYAGIHATLLGVRPEDVPDAVRTVWESLEGEGAHAYGRASGMAVLLQPQLYPHAAGVLFTVNPQTGSWREMVLEAVRGQGEALVSGRQAPQWAVFRRPRRGWLGRPRVRRVSEERVPQAQHWALVEGTLTAQPVPEAEESLPVLPPATQLHLCRLALAAERAFEEPVDVEWAFHEGQLTLLQARPITRIGTPRKRDVLWTRRFLGERFPTPPTPLSWSLLAPQFEHLIGFPSVQERYLGGGPALRLVDGYPYLNVTIFQHLLFKWPGAPAPEFMLELIPPEEADAWRRRFAGRADWAVYRAIFETVFRERRWERFAWNPFTNHRVWEAFEHDLKRDIEALETATEEPEVRLQRYRTLIREYLAVHVCSLLFANLWYQLLDGALATWMGPGDWMKKLAVCPPGNHTLRTNEALWELGQHASAADLERLAHGHSEGPFAVELQRFLQEFGHRAEASWEIFSPRWSDDPSRLLPLFGGREPAEHAAASEATFQTTRTTVLASIPGWRKRVLDGLIFLTRRYLLLRENQRFLFDRLLAGLHTELRRLEHDRGLQGIEWHTIDELLGEGVVPRETLRQRAEAHQRQATQHPPVFLRGDTPIDLAPAGRKLQGLGISGGRVVGVVRVVRTLKEGAALRDGEILVAPAVDPGWTPLLLRAGAVVLELGSMLSHGAVIAREYDVPGVVNVDGATSLLSTGQEITVDGSRGLVWIGEPT